MKLLPKCSEITRMVLAGEDRQLGTGERLLVRAHCLICKACSNFGKQVGLMRKATELWRGYSDR